MNRDFAQAESAASKGTLSTLHFGHDGQVVVSSPNLKLQVRAWPGFQGPTVPGSVGRWK